MSEVYDKMLQALSPFAGQGEQKLGFWRTMAGFGFNKDTRSHRSAVRELRENGTLTIGPGGFTVNIQGKSSLLHKVSSDQVGIDPVALARELVQEALKKAERIGALERENQLLQEGIQELKDEVARLRSSGGVLLEVPLTTLQQIRR